MRMSFGTVRVYATLPNMIHLHPPRPGQAPPRALGTWLEGPLLFGRKASVLVAFFVWARAAYPRYRYYQLMRLGWKVFLPVSLAWTIWTSGALVAFAAAPLPL